VLPKEVEGLPLLLLKLILGYEIPGVAWRVKRDRSSYDVLLVLVALPTRGLAVVQQD
jgi:hypothetical protein